MAEELYTLKKVQIFHIHQSVFFIITMQIRQEGQYNCIQIQLIPVHLIVFSSVTEHYLMVEPSLFTQIQSIQTLRIALLKKIIPLMVVLYILVYAQYIIILLIALSSKIMQSETVALYIFSHNLSTLNLRIVFF